MAQFRNELLRTGKLFPHLEEINYQAQSGISEPLKAQEQMSWVQQMNTLAQQVRELVYTELIYTEKHNPPDGVFLPRPVDYYFL